MPKKGEKLNDRQRAALIESNRTRVISDETREKMRAAHLGKPRGPFSEEHRARLSAAKTGKPNKPLTEEARKNISEGQQRRGPRSQETKDKIRAALTGNRNGLGHVKSAEARAKISAANMGHGFSAEALQKMSDSRSGELSPAWKGGETSDRGYVSVYSPKHPRATCKRRVMKHRLVMEASLGRYLTPEEVVHHIDEKPSNNDRANLMLFANSATHLKHHAALCRAARAQQDAVDAPAA